MNNFKTFITEQKNQFFSTRKEIEEWLEEYGLAANNIDDKTLIVDIDYDLILNDKTITALPCQFGRVNGSIDFTNCTKLSSLIGFPLYLAGYCEADHLAITSLQGTEKSTIDGYFSAQNCKINTVQYFPQIIKRDRDVFLKDNPIKSLQGIHLTGKMRGGQLMLNTSNIQSHILGVALLGCNEILNNNSKIVPNWVNLVNDILKKHRNNTDRRKVALIMQQELMDHGYPQLAQL